MVCKPDFIVKFFGTNKQRTQRQDTQNNLKLTVQTNK